jgi:hypothetical protein
MTKKSFKKEKKGHVEEWEWKETSEVKLALEKLHQNIHSKIKEENNDKAS